MAIRKTVEDTFVVNGPRDEYLSRVMRTLKEQGFTDVDVRAQLYQVDASYRKMTVYGKIAVTLTPDGEKRTTVRAVATGNVDNIYAFFRSPGRRIIDRFKQGLIL